jgi:hypothetical protein
MIPHRLKIQITSVFLIFFSINIASAQKQKAPRGGRIAVVADERLSALRDTPNLTGKLVRRLSRGRLVAIRSVKTNHSGIVFYLVNVTSRTRGWLQREAVVSPSHVGDDERLLSLIKNASDFDRIARARIFLDHFQRSPLRPEVLLLLADEAEGLSVKLSREATRRVSENAAAPEFSYFLNYTGLDRYNRQGVVFVFDPKTKRLHYDGAAWREIIRRYPRTPQASIARERLATLSALLPY